MTGSRFPVASPSSLVAASHNLMHGLRLDALLPHYLELRDREGLELLCLQEDRPREGGGPLPSARIAAALGPGFEVVRDDGCPGLALVYDGRMLALERSSIIPLPRLAALSWLERLYIAGGRTKQKHLLVADFRPIGRTAPLAAFSFHLDTAGGNTHRGAQVRAIAEALAGSGRGGCFVGGGDTNAFAWRRQPEILRDLLSPLAALGAVEPPSGDAQPTHYFARQDEPKLTHRLCMGLGRLGLDLPLRYDVVCTNLGVLARGQVVTPGSDHDLVWARLSMTGGSGSQSHRFPLTEPAAGD